MTLRDLAAAGGTRVGAAVASAPFDADDDGYRHLLASEFNSVTAERSMKWLHLHPELNRWDWSAAEDLIDFAEQHEMDVRAHAVVWPHWGTPEFVSTCTDPAALRRHLREHLETMFRRWRGRVARYDLVNEPLHWLEGRLAEQVWAANLGDDYLAEVLTIAHKVDPDVELWINETHVDVVPDKHAAFKRIIADLVERGVPLHGVGLQGHQLYPDFSPAPPTPEHLASVVATYADMGLEVAITEMDVLVDPADSDRLGVQARIYGELVDAALSVDACREITFWGLTDAHSWVDQHFGTDRSPLLFDRAGHPKPAYEAVAAAFAARARRQPLGAST